MKQSFLAIITWGLLSALVMTGCTKEEAPVDPNPVDTTHTLDPPSTPNYFVCQTDSMGISLVVAMRSAYKGDVIDWSFKVSDSQILKLYTTHDLFANGSYPLLAESAAYGGGNGVYAVYMEGFEEEDLSQGTLEVKVILGQPEFTLSGTTASGRTIRMHYWGTAHNLTHPLGSGQFVYGSKSLGLDIAYSQLYLDLYEYAFTDTVSSFGVTFYSVFPLTDGTYALTDDMELVGEGQAVDLWLDLEGSTLTGDVTNGTLTVAMAHDEIQITFNGELEGLPVSGSYSGQIVSLGEGLLK